MSPKETAYIVERLAVRFMSMVADYERKLVEHRDAFGARTSADAKIIEGLRRELFMLTGLNDKLIVDREEAWKERDGLLTQVQDQRAEIERLQWENQTMHKDAEDGYAEAINVLGDPIALSKERDALRAEVADLRGIFDMVHASLGIKRGDHIGNAIAALKTQTPKRSHPVKAGEWVKNSDGGIAQVLEVRKDWYLDGWWTFANCEPCDTPADHDTPAGKEAAEAVIRDSQTTEIKVGDVVEVVSASSCVTFSTDIGRRGKVTHLGDKTIDVKEVPGYALPSGGVVDICDVRKVTQ